MDVTVFTTVYLAVLFAELIGDKLLFGTSALAARFGSTSVVAGALPALGAKAFAAVALGGVIGRLPTSVAATASCLAFALMAYTIWRDPGNTGNGNHILARPRGFQLRGAVAAFTAIFFAEWGDPGQLATVAFAARTDAPGMVWLAATAAMTTKTLIALSIGTVVHRVAPPRVIRWTGVSLAAALAIAAVLERE
jgi:putative Ca2+/H+ antiporter (TMEM165/GDT1 family)